jgi:hypothetical protein
MTLVKQRQTQHQSLNLASAVRLLRRSWAFLTGGGVLNWTVTGGIGTLTWDAPLKVETPLSYLTLELVAGSVETVAQGEGIYVTLPALTTDDPAGSAFSGATVQVTPAHGALPYDEQILPLGYHANDGSDRLILLDGTVLSPGIPSTVGGRVLSGSRHVLTGTGEATYTLPFHFLTDQNQLNVWINGQLQVPGTETEGPPIGYLEADSADYVESDSGTPPEGFSDQVVFQAGSLPSEDDVVIFALSGGGQGPPGPAGFGGLDDAYRAQSDIPLDLPNPSQVEPVTIKEPAALGWVGGGYPPGFDARVLQVLRSSGHSKEGPSLFALGSGHVGLPGLVFFRGREGSTFLSEAEGWPGSDLGLWILAPGVGLPDPEGKWALTFLERGVSAPESVGELMDLLQGGDLHVSATRGQVAGNRYGELATGRGVDFIRWHILDVLLGSIGSGTTITLSPPLVFDESVIDPDSVFLGGFARLSWFSGTTEVQDFFHVNPSAVAGGNPYELRFSLRTPITGPRELHATYGSGLIDSTVRVVLFFSHGYASGEEIS